MVSAGHPLAAQAGLRMLERGGNAIDAMIATQLVLTLVEPQSSGLGGGAFLLYYDAHAKRIHAFDGRETAPSGATRDLFPRARRADAVSASRGGRTLRGRPRHAAPARSGARAARQAAVGDALRARRSSSPRRAFRFRSA
jgi:gamma-glutamyltranspeptidase/glutathione hydrolase